MKEGIEYFSHAVGERRRTELRYLRARFGMVALAYWTVLQELIYERGYYLPWDARLSVLMADEEFKTTPTMLHEFIEALFEEGLLDREQYVQHGILTSDEFQRHYAHATSRRKKPMMIYDYLCLDPLSLESYSKTLCIVTLGGELVWDFAEVQDEPAEAATEEVILEQLEQIASEIHQIQGKIADVNILPLNVDISKHSNSNSNTYSSSHSSKEQNSYNKEEFCPSGGGSGGGYVPQQRCEAEKRTETEVPEGSFAGAGAVSAEKARPEPPPPPEHAPTLEAVMGYARKRNVQPAYAERFYYTYATQNWHYWEKKRGRWREIKDFRLAFNSVWVAEDKAVGKDRSAQPGEWEAWQQEQTYIYSPPPPGKILFSDVQVGEYIMLNGIVCEKTSVSQVLKPGPQGTRGVYVSLARDVHVQKVDPPPELEDSVAISGDATNHTNGVQSLLNGLYNTMGYPTEKITEVA